MYKTRILKKTYGEYQKGNPYLSSWYREYIQFFKRDGQEVMLVFDNPDLISSFCDCFENINEEEFYSKGETIKRIKKLLRTYWIR